MSDIEIGSEWVQKKKTPKEFEVVVLSGDSLMVKENGEGFSIPWYTSDFLEHHEPKVNLPSVANISCMRCKEAHPINSIEYMCFTDGNCQKCRAELSGKFCTGQGRKDDSSKRRYSLLPKGAVNSVVDVLEFGSKKYTVINICDKIITGNIIKDHLWQRLGIASDVVIENQSWQRDCVLRATESRHSIKASVGLAEKQDTSCQKIFYVDLATKKNDSQDDLRSLMLSKFIKENIVKPQNLKKERERETQNACHAQSTSRSKNDTAFCLTLQNTDLTNSSIKILWQEDAKSAEAQNDHTLTTTIKLDYFEVCFVVSATKDLDCYKMTLQLLQAYFGTSPNISQISRQESGLNNWQKVPSARTRYYDAALRHIDSWWQGEKTDSETGLPHLAHAICCLMFLMWFDSEAADD